MKILVVSFYDDNFGDMLIRTCFENILRCALESLGMDEKEYTIEKMNLKDAREEKVLSSDLVIFAGGALFGFNYQNFFESIEKIITVSQSKNIPVVFSSMGVNNVDSCVGEPESIKKLLRSECIKGLSVRENPSLFADYLEGNELAAVPVCDPAVWAGTVYNTERKNSKTVGINVVRGGLFKANGLKWKLEDEEEYLFRLKGIFDEKGIDYKFFTNGSVLDCNSLYHFADKYGIPEEKLVFPDSSKQLIETVSSFGAVAAIRLHSAIVSYSLGIPSVNLNWNEKVPYFYENTGFPDRTVAIDENTAYNVAEKISCLLDSEYRPNEEYMMKLYDFLFDTLRSIFNFEKTEKYGFGTLCKRAGEIGVSDDETVTDLKTKIKRGAFVYYKLFESDREKGRTVKQLKKDISSLEEKSRASSDGYEKRISELERELGYNEELAEKYKKQYNDEFIKSQKYKSKLDRIYNKPLVRLYLAIKRLFKKK